MDRDGGIRRRITRGMIPVLALHVGTEFYRLRRKPPVTAGLILANTLIYLRPGALDRLLPTIDEVWFNPHLIVKYVLTMQLLTSFSPLKRSRDLGSNPKQPSYQGNSLFSYPHRRPSPSACRPSSCPSRQSYFSKPVCMADPKLDQGFLFDEQGRTDILRSPFFDVHFSYDDETANDYIDQILFQFTQSIEEHIRPGHWEIIDRHPSPPTPATFPPSRILSASFLIAISLLYGDLRRFFLSAFYHMGESHLVYNMMSLLWKGIQLETSMGSVEFASMVAALLGLSQGITLLLAKSLLLFFDYETAYYNQYAVGFSGVLFAMKVVLNSESDNLTSLNGLLVPARHAAWVELILIQLFVPGVSFLGHLGGILAGLLYLKLRRSYSGPDPLAALIRKVAALISWPVKLLRSLIGWQTRRITGRGTVGSRRPVQRVYYDVWRCTACTYDNSALADICEMCSTERSGHGFASPTPTNNNGALSLEEVRRRRLERFSR
ncbi:hypothetical protein M5K25_021734 [Dendrobium thyrsiflorum]|uniref:RanBP2-type domain-containing protein n=1 Tax=Dendrobium thyrsiflorum TaxID=117978 RepID=A0ABD0UAX7_DENTH